MVKLFPVISASVITPLLLSVALSANAGQPCPTGYIFTPVGKGGYCTATPITTSGGASSRRDNKLFVGINWKFGGVKAPEFVLGYQSVKVESDKDVRGGRLEFTALLKDGFRPHAFKLSAVDGKTSGQGLLGAGYAFGQGFLLNAGLQIPYVTGGLDYVVGGGLTPYAGLNTLGKQKVPSGSLGGTTCPSSAGFGDPVLDGGTCFVTPAYIP